MELNEEQRKDLMEAQNIQQQLQVVLMQKQQLLLQKTEAEKASEEVEKASGQMYRFAGGVLVPKEKSVLQEELKEELESVEVRVNALGKQEKKLRERFEELRKKLEKAFPKSGQDFSGDEGGSGDSAAAL